MSTMSSSVIFVGLLIGFLALSCAQLLPLEEEISNPRRLPSGIAKIKHEAFKSSSEPTKMEVLEMKGLNLTGVIPEELGNLTELEKIDFTRNYISGSIPASLSRSPIRLLYLLGNQLSGLIPTDGFTLLRELELEDNQFEGPLPQNLGRMTQLERILLSGNNFTGTIPESYRNLKNLIVFRIGGSQLSGKIPEFIGNWSKLQIL
nr:probable LRR receptor-like serine/threonine-protein kinase At1g53430 [Malus domestica]